MNGCINIAPNHNPYEIDWLEMIRIAFIHLSSQIVFCDLDVVDLIRRQTKESSLLL